MVNKTDLAIIGSGPGGYITAIRAAKLGIETTVVEKGHLGGVCLNWGCMPTKSLFHLAQTLDYVKKADAIGINIKDYEVDFKKVMERKDTVVNILRKSIGSHFKKNNINLIKGEAKLVSENKIDIEGQSLEAKNIIIATGSSPSQIPPFDFSKEGILTNRKVLSLQSLPSSMLVVGGGVIGSEFANIFSTLGTKVTIIEILPTILAAEDDDVSGLMASVFKDKGIEVLTDSTVESVEGKDGSFVCKTKGGKEIKAEKILVSVGRKPNTENIGLEEVGVKTDSKGYIKANSKLQTNIENIYAIGDAIGGYQLAHVASSEGKIAVENILGKDKSIDYNSVPYAVFTMPEIGVVGLTEKKAKKEGINIKIGKFPFTHNGKAFIDNETEGFVKIITLEDTGEILGAHAIGPKASDIIHEAVVAMKGELPIDYIAETIHAHPTIAESMLEASEDVFGLATHI